MDFALQEGLPCSETRLSRDLGATQVPWVVAMLLPTVAQVGQSKAQPLVQGMPEPGPTRLLAEVESHSAVGLVASRL